MASVLVVGGAGYVGSSVAAHLLDQGEDVWILDDLSTGHRSLVPDSIIASGRFMESRAGDREVVRALLQAEKFDAVFHFAAKSIVSESVKNPAAYFENNVDQTKRLLDEMISAGVKRFIFSSTAAVYGDPEGHEISEDRAKKPIHPYGVTKLEVEKMLEKYGSLHGLRSIALRYFNAAGADSKLRVGEHHIPETHLIPNLLGAAIENKPISIFGTDYPTRDGTCLRDYVHVEDLAVAHVSAFKRMMGEGSSSQGFEAFNLGSESGFTVKEVILAAEKVVGKKILQTLEPRRDGDPATLVAIAKNARKHLGFNPRKNTLESIIETAFKWEEKRRKPKKAIFLDRDGTLNFDPGYLNDPAQLELLPGVIEGLQSLKSAGYIFVVVSNQSGIERGKITHDQLHRIHEKMDLLLATHGIRIHHYALCFHHPDTNCECRKPKPKLILESAERYSIDLSQSYMVGDKISDVECGQNAELAGSYLVGTGSVKTHEAVFFPTLGAVADGILRGVKSPKSVR